MNVLMGCVFLVKFLTNVKIINGAWSTGAVEFSHYTSVSWSHLEDLLLQAVDAQRPFSKIQAHATVADAVHHVQVGLGAATPYGHRYTEDVDITLGLGQGEEWVNKKHLDCLLKI